MRASIFQPSSSYYLWVISVAIKGGEDHNQNFTGVSSNQ